MTKPLYALAITFVLLGTIFTLFPETLEHSPVGFEKRGVVHHFWHGTLLIGALALLIGLVMRDRLFEAIGLIGVGLAVLLNLVAQVTADDESLSGSLSTSASGIGTAVRLVVLSLVAARL